MKKIQFFLPLLIILTYSSSFLYAAERNNDDKLFSVGIYALAGTGFEKYELGQNSHNEDVEFYGGGGGIGGLFAIGISPLDRVDLEIAAGYQKYDDEEVPYTDVEFRRFIYQATLKFEIARFNSSNLKLGFGAGIYKDPRLKSEIDGDNIKIEYDDAVGYHMTFEYELIYEKNWAINFGIKAYTIEYDADKYTDNGVVKSVDTMDKDLKEFNGDGIDLTVGLVKYF